MSLRHPRRRAFTLVELLVVIATIAVLISILLPTMGKARQQAKTVSCMSNLRQIGLGLAAYSWAWKGYLPPGQQRPAVGQPYVNSWATLLVDGKFLSAPQQHDINSPQSFGDSVFRCPGGRDEAYIWAAPILSPAGDGFWRTTADTGTVIDIWYGVNGSWLPHGGPYLINRYPNDYDNRIITNINRVSLKHEVVAAFDGWYMHGRFGSRMSVNARHNRLSTANFLFVDGHVESINVARDWTPLQLTDHNAMVTMTFPKWVVQ